MANDGAKKAAEEKAPESTSKKESTEKPQSGRMMFYIIIAVVLVLNVVIAFVLIQVTKPKAPEKEEIEIVDSSSTGNEVRTTMGAALDKPIDAIVNIAGTDGERFLKIAIVLEYNDKYKDLPAEIEKRRPRFKNMLIDQLSSMSLMELNEPDAKDKIRKEFLRRANGILDEKTGVLADVWLDQFIIQ